MKKVYIDEVEFDDIVIDYEVEVKDLPKDTWFKDNLKKYLESNNDGHPLNRIV